MLKKKGHVSDDFWTDYYQDYSNQSSELEPIGLTEQMLNIYQQHRKQKQEQQN